MLESARVSEHWAEAREAHRRTVRGRIIEAAAALLAERGAAGVTMSSLAERAGISRATLYAHFPDFEHVLVAWVSDEVDRFLASLEQRVTGVDDPLDRIAVYVMAQCEYFADPEHRMPGGGAPLSPAMQRALDVAVDACRALIRPALEEAAERALIRPRIDLDLHTELIVHLVAGARTALVAGKLDPEAAAHAITALLERGIRRYK